VRASTSPARRRGDGLQRFEDELLDHFGQLGLPIEDVLVGLDQRRAMLTYGVGALELLDADQRSQSRYISKMFAAAAAGLFDAALNYLWDETIGQLRARVASYDLAYFFDVAVTSPDRRKGLSTEEDLRQVDDASLLRATHSMEFISNTGYKQLELINYMRNHASAAHPNQIGLTALQLADWLETCIREVINLPLNSVVVEIRKLLGNVRKVRLTAAEIATTAAFFHRLGEEQVDNLAAGLFGIYTDAGSAAATRDNVRSLWPELWEYLGDEARYGFGTRYGRFLANADQDKAQLARELLDLVEGAAYFPEPVRVAELDRALDDLLSAHHGWNNFHNEPPLVRRLAELVGEKGDIPTPLGSKYVLTLVEVFLTNGSGVAYNADPVYRSLLQELDSGLAALALRSFKDTTIANRLQFGRPATQWPQLLDLVAPKLTRRTDRELLKEVRAFTGPLDQLRNDSAIGRLIDPAAGLARTRKSGRS